VDDDNVNLKHPVYMTYNRLHHRAIETTQTSAQVQEKLTIKFRQLILNTQVFNIGLGVAMNTGCI
jgi:hypothetical protein